MAVTETPSWRSTSWKKLRCCRRSSSSSAPSTCVPRVVSRKLVRCALVAIGGAGERADADEEGRNASSKPPLRRGAVCACTVQSCVRFDWRVTRLKGRAVVHQDVEQRLRTTELTDGLQVAIELHELIHGHEHALQHERLRSGEETPQGSAPLMGKGGGGLPATALRAPSAGGPVAGCGGPRMHVGRTSRVESSATSVPYAICSIVPWLTTTNTPTRRKRRSISKSSQK